MAKKCVIYVRISVTMEQSVSVERQIEAARQYAAARGWTVVEVFIDDGVSASRNKPEDREGWKALLASPEKYDVVVIWKVDRLARRVIDFLHADAALQARKAGVVAVEDPVDMSTAQGRAFATILAVFGEMEAAAISARVKAARNHLVRAGRVVGGTVPYGLMTVPNPDGPGLVLAHDPDRIDFVRGMVAQVQRGSTLYAVQQWLNGAGAPVDGWASGSESATKRRKPARERKGGWSYSTVERLLRNPVLAGMTAFNPGNDTKVRGMEVLRDDHGLPVIDESIAIMSVTDWRAMVARLDDRESAQSKPRASKASTSPLLSGLVWCQHCQKRMWRARLAPGREGYVCKGECGQTITSFEPLVIAEFLRQKGSEVRWTMIEDVHEGGAAVLPEIEHRLAELRAAIDATTDRDQRRTLRDQEEALLDLRDQKREQAPAVTLRWDEAGIFSESWEKAGADVAAQRAVLNDAVTRIWVSKGGVGRQNEAKVLARLTWEWRRGWEPVGEPSVEWLADPL